MNWLSRFSNMADELRQHSQVELLSFQSFPPVEEEQFELLEKRYNITLPKNVRAFYRETNGLQLSWILKNNEHMKKNFEKYFSDIESFEKNVVNFEKNNENDSLSRLVY